MATYTGIGFDGSKIRTGLNSDTVDFAGSVQVSNGLDVAANGASIAGGTDTDTLTVTGDASVAGDLTVTGDIVSRGAVNLVVQDNFIDLNFANSTTTAEAGGLTVQMNRASGFTASTVTTFVAGSAGVSNPTFTNTDAGSSSLLAAGDIVIIDGATQTGNNGIYVVQGVNQASFPQTVTIKGIGTTATDPATPFAQTQFEAESGASATAFKTDLFVQLVADGSTAFTDSGGSTFAKGTFLTAFHANATESSFSNDGGYSTVESTLQSAYNGGNTILTTGTSPISFSLGADAAGFSVLGSSAGNGQVLIGNASNAVDSINMRANGSASTFVSDGQNLTIQTLTSGTLGIQAAAALDIDGVAGTLNLTGGLVAALSGGASSITSTSQNLSIATATSGELDLSAAGLMDINAAANLDIDVTGTFDMLSTGAFSIDGTGASNIGVASGNLDLATTTSGNITVSAVGNADFRSTGGTAIFRDAAKSISYDGSGALAIGATTCNITPDSTFNVDSGGAQTYDPTGAFTVGGDGDTTVVSATASQGSTGAIVLNASSASGDVVIQNSGSAKFTVAASAVTAVDIANLNGGIAVDSTAFTVANTSGNVSTSGTLNVDSTSTFADNVTLDKATSVNLAAVFNNGSDQTFTIDASNSGVGDGILSIGGNAAQVLINSGSVSTLSLTCGENIAAGNIVAVANSSSGVGSAGQAIKADNSNANRVNIVGIAMETKTSGNAIAIQQVGKIASSGLTAGATLFLGTGGAVTGTAPTAAGTTVYQIGFAESTSSLVIQTAFIMQNG